MSPRDPPKDRSGDDAVETVPLDTDDGRTVVIGQQPSGSQNGIGQGEFPDRATPPRRVEDVAAEAGADDVRDA